MALRGLVGDTLRLPEAAPTGPNNCRPLPLGPEEAANMLLIDCHTSHPRQGHLAKLFFPLAKSLPQGSDRGLPLLADGLGCSSRQLGAYISLHLLWQ